MKTVYFKSQGKNESITGEATIVYSYKDGHNLAAESFEGSFTTNKITTTESDREGKRYSIYENYQDSGSEDYVFFAVEFEK